MSATPPLTDERLIYIEKEASGFWTDPSEGGIPIVRGATPDDTLALVAEVRRLRADARENLTEEDRLRKILGARDDEDEIDAARRVVDERDARQRGLDEAMTRGADAIKNARERAEKAERERDTADQEINADEAARLDYMRRATKAERQRDEQASAWARDILALSAARTAVCTLRAALTRIAASGHAGDHVEDYPPCGCGYCCEQKATAAIDATPAPPCPHAEQAAEAEAQRISEAAEATAMREVLERQQHRTVIARRRSPRRGRPSERMICPVCAEPAPCSAKRALDPRGVKPTISFVGGPMDVTLGKLVADATVGKTKTLSLTEQALVAQRKKYKTLRGYLRTVLLECHAQHDDPAVCTDPHHGEVCRKAALKIADRPTDTDGDPGDTASS